MTIINHECYISLEVAKLLKKAGFDWERETCYIGKSEHPYKYHKFFNWNMPRKDFEKDGSDNLFHAFITQKKTNSFISAPTLEVAQRWLREVKGYDIEIYVCHHYGISAEKGYFYELVINNEDYEDDDISNQFSGTYEQAQEAGIKKALELILEEGE